MFVHTFKLSKCLLVQIVVFQRVFFFVVLLHVSVFSTITNLHPYINVYMYFPYFVWFYFFLSRNVLLSFNADYSRFYLTFPTIYVCVSLSRSRSICLSKGSHTSFDFSFILWGFLALSFVPTIKRVFYGTSWHFIVVDNKGLDVICNFIVLFIRVTYICICMHL